MRRHQLVIALTGLVLVACGDDGGGGGGPAQPSDSGLGTVRPDSGASASDAGPPADGGLAVGDSGPGMDATVQNDSGIDSSAAAADSAVRDSASPQQQDAARDSATGSTAGDAAFPGSGDVSAACLSCLTTNCECDANCQEYLGSPLSHPRLTDVCSMFPGMATTGPAAGAPLSELCEELVECERTTGCGRENDGWNCFCGDLEISVCQGDVMAMPNGPCLDEIYNAAQSDDRREVTESIVNATTAAGAAAQLVACETAKCADECYSPCAGKADGTKCGDSNPGEPERVCMAGKCPDSKHFIDDWRSHLATNMPTDAGTQPSGSDAGSDSGSRDAGTASGATDSGTGSSDAGSDSGVRDSGAAVVDSGAPDSSNPACPPEWGDGC